MASFGVLEVRDVFAMLDECAKGHIRSTTEHYHQVRYKGLTYPSVPLGGHGRRKKAEIKVGHVRQMIRHLKIDVECAKRMLPPLGP